MAPARRRRIWRMGSRARACTRSESRLEVRPHDRALPSLRCHDDAGIVPGVRLAVLSLSLWSTREHSASCGFLLTQGSGNLSSCSLLVTSFFFPLPASPSVPGCRSNRLSAFGMGTAAWSTWRALNRRACSRHVGCFPTAGDLNFGRPPAGCSFSLFCVAALVNGVCVFIC